MVPDSLLLSREPNLGTLNRFTKLNVLALLGQAWRESNRGNPDRAVLYLVTALVALKSVKLSVALQGVLTVDRVVGSLAGSRPLQELFEDLSGDRHR